MIEIGVKKELKKNSMNAVAVVVAAVVSSVEVHDIRDHLAGIGVKSRLSL